MASLSSACTSGRGVGLRDDDREPHLPPRQRVRRDGVRLAGSGHESEDEDGQQQETAHGCSYRQVWYGVARAAVMVRSVTGGNHAVLFRRRQVTTQTGVFVILW